MATSANNNNSAPKKDKSDKISELLHPAKIESIKKYLGTELLCVDSGVAQLLRLSEKGSGKGKYWTRFKAGVIAYCREKHGTPSLRLLDPIEGERARELWRMDIKKDFMTQRSDSENLLIFETSDGDFMGFKFSEAQEANSFHGTVQHRMRVDLDKLDADDQETVKQLADQFKVDRNNKKEMRVLIGNVIRRGDAIRESMKMPPKKKDTQSPVAKFEPIAEQPPPPSYSREMRVFESLNCILCKKPFARVANQPRSPLQFACGLAMCHECFGKEANTDKAKRKHQCGKSACFKSANYAYFLIDVLSQENALVFTPMGYVLLKPFKIPECPICHDEYSNEIEAKKSFAFDCGHIVCVECCLKMKFSFGIQCPTCRNITHSDLNKQKNRFHDFLNELPEMTRQMEKMDNPKIRASIKASINSVLNALASPEDDRSCSECHKNHIAEEMFYCGECGFEICGTCAYKKHRSHEAISLLEKQANQMAMELQQESRNVIKTYKDLFPELHKELLEDIDSFETKLLSKEGILKEASTFADLREKHESFTQIESTFESFAENYLPHLRKFDTEVKKLLQTLKEIPDA